MLQYASPVQRILELIIDYIVFWLVFFIYLFFFEMDENGRFSFFQAFFSLPVLIFWVVYFPVLEGITGQTLGKRIMGIRLETLQGDELKFTQSIVRRLFDVVDLLFFGIVGILVMSRSDKNQRVGDRVAGTIVIIHREVACRQCKVVSILDRNDLIRGQFTCPDCGTLND